LLARAPRARSGIATTSSAAAKGGGAATTRLSLGSLARSLARRKPQALARKRAACTRARVCMCAHVFAPARVRTGARRLAKKAARSSSKKSICGIPRGLRWPDSTSTGYSADSGMPLVVPTTALPAAPPPAAAFDMLPRKVGRPRAREARRRAQSF
jgi:hypothetical protein